SDLVVNVQSTNSTNQEYGAMRLRGTKWSGAGGVIKRGPGMAGFTQAGKVISGNILVEQGVLTFSEPSISSLLSTNITVQSGGQLRLSSAFTTTNVPRTNNIKGVLNLAGSGRSGVGTNENLGVLGALRLETGTTGTTSLLTNVVNLTATADIHVPAANTIQLNGPLTASSNNVILTKSGGGTLTLATNSSSFTAGLTVNRGTLNLSNPVMTNTTNALVLAADTTLTGSGRWGGALQASGGASLAFSLGASPAGSAPLRVGSATLTGSNSVALTVANDAVPGSYPLLAVDGSFSGTNNISLAAAPASYPTASLSFSNGTLYAVLPSPVATALALEVAGGGASALTLPSVTVRAVNASSQVDTTFTSTVTLTVAGPNGYTANHTTDAVAGVATFANVAVPIGGNYTLTATSGALNAGAGSVSLVHGPAPAADAVTKTNNTTQHRYSFAALLANDTRVTTNGTVLTNNVLSIVGVTAGTGNSVSIRSSFVILTPSTNSPETFTYHVTDGAVTNSAIVTVTLAPDTNVVYSDLQVVGFGSAVFNGASTSITNYFIGVPNQTYGIQYKGELTNAAWDTAGPTNSGASGSFGVHFQKAGDHVTDWNTSMFFRGYLTNTNQ
ncbi:MAG: hypothetical protein ACKOPT_06935, partial [Cyanobium sp.]